MMISKRKREPAHYMLKIESFSLLSEDKTSVIKSDVFEASGHKWRLELYPNGNKEVENAGDHIALYLVIRDTASLSKGWEVFVDVNFYVYDHITHYYATFHGVDGIRFHEKRMKWGFDKLISLESFRETKNGYLCSNDSCVFGAEVFSLPACYTKKDRCLSLVKPPASMNTYTWTIDKFSAVTNKYLKSEVFKVGKVKWRLFICPKGIKSGKDVHFSIFLYVSDAGSLPAGWRVYTKCKIRVKNQCSRPHVQGETDHWFYNVSPVVGFPKFMLLSTLSDPANGFLLDDKLIIEAEIYLVGTFRNFM